MARLIPFICLLCCASTLAAIAVEYDLDKPLDLPGKWRYYTGAHFYAQHRCNDAQMRLHARRIENYLGAPSRESDPEIGPLLQVRLYASAADYRRHLKFSKYRDGHFNKRLNLIVSYCDVSAILLAEQLNLHALAAKPLRKWQRVFVAELLPLVSQNRVFAAFADAEKDKRAKLLAVLLSNHWPGRTERASLRRLAILLAERQQLEVFLEKLIEPVTADDTGLETLEALFPEGIQSLLESPGEGNLDAKGNKTLRKGQMK